MFIWAQPLSFKHFQAAFVVPFRDLGTPELHLQCHLSQSELNGCVSRRVHSHMPIEQNHEWQ